MGPLGGSPTVTFEKAACGDGWGLAAGTGDGYTGPVIGLFELLDGRWHDLQLDDGADLAYELEIYDIPVSLFARLGAELGTSVAAQVSAAWPPSRLGLAADASVSSLLEADGSQWLVAASQPAGGKNDTPAWVTITVLHWSGRSWVREGQVDQLPDQGNIIGEGQWYEVVTVPGSALPGFRLGNFTGVNEYTWSVVVGYTDGSWRVISKVGA
jgi:hypothetical protein